MHLSPSLEHHIESQFLNSPDEVKEDYSYRWGYHHGQLFVWPAHSAWHADLAAFLGEPGKVVGTAFLDAGGLWNTTNGISYAKEYHAGDPEKAEEGMRLLEEWHGKPLVALPSEQLPLELYSYGFYG